MQEGAASMEADALRYSAWRNAGLRCTVNCRLRGSAWEEGAGQEVVEEAGGETGGEAAVL